jgi:hypothetical protein
VLLFSPVLQEVLFLPLYINKSEQRISMTTFYYKFLQEMEPIGNTPYKTVYIKQTHHEHARLRNWLVSIAEQIIGATEVNASAAEWFSSPLREFKKSRKGQYYSPEELLTDMIGQLSLGKDLPQAMLDRWNRLTAGTPWVIDLQQATNPKTSARSQARALFE